MNPKPYEIAIEFLMEVWIANRLGAPPALYNTTADSTGSVPYFSCRCAETARQRSTVRDRARPLEGQGSRVQYFIMPITGILTFRSTKPGEKRSAQSRWITCLYGRVHLNLLENRA